MAKLKPLKKVSGEHTQLVRQLSSIQHQLHVVGLCKTADIVGKALLKVGFEIDEVTK